MMAEGSLRSVSDADERLSQARTSFVTAKHLRWFPLQFSFRMRGASDRLHVLFRAVPGPRASFS